MPEGVRVDLSPFMEILSKDMLMYHEMFDKVMQLKWKEAYGREEEIGRLNNIRGMLDLKAVNPKDELEFSRQIGECGKKIMDEVKKIRKEVTGVFEKIAKEEISLGEEGKKEEFEL